MLMKGSMINTIKGIKRTLAALWSQYVISIDPTKFGYFSKTSFISGPASIMNQHNIFMYEDTHIMSGCNLLVTKGKFIMKHHSCAAQNLLVLTGSHISKPGTWFLTMENRADDFEKDVIIEEDAWVGANVTLLAGSVIGRGAIVGAGAVVRDKVPPYSVVTGNPAKVVGYRFNPLEVIEHEKALYPESERLSMDILMQEYQTYYYDRIEEINKYLKL